MFPAPPHIDNEQTDNISSSAPRPFTSIAKKPASLSSTPSPAQLSSLPHPTSASPTTAVASIPMPQNVLVTPASNHDRGHSTLRLNNLEPWMDEPYALQVAEIMQWTPVSVRIPNPPPHNSSSPASYSALRQLPLSDPPSSLAYQSQQPNNPGHLFLTFPNAAAAASVLSQLQAANAAQTRAGRSPIRLPNSERPMDLDYASPEHSLACWTYHANSQRAEGGSRTGNPEPSSSGANQVGSEGASVGGSSHGTGRKRGGGSRGGKVSASPRSTPSPFATSSRAGSERGGGRSVSNPQSSTSFLANSSHSSHNSSSTLHPRHQPSPGPHQSRAQEFSIFVGDPRA